MTTPTPPPGYKLVKGIDIKDCVPEGSKLWLYGSMSWRPSVDIGEKANPALYDDFYAIPSSPESITNEAKTIISGDRASDYGDANESFSRISNLWSAYTGATISPWDVAQMMILLKVSRAKTSRKRDTLIDIIGYAECASQLNLTNP